MKKLFFILLAFAIPVSLLSCDNDDSNNDAPVLGASVEVKVENSLGASQSGMDVYMFKNVQPDESTDLSSASKKVTSNSDGKAIFKLNLTELNITESKTPLYFAAYYKSGDSFMLKAGDESITVKRNDEKSITIIIPI